VEVVVVVEVVLEEAVLVVKLELVDVVEVELVVEVVLELDLTEPGPKFNAAFGLGSGGGAAGNTRSTFDTTYNQFVYAYTTLSILKAICCSFRIIRRVINRF
jgi:hypothetical protein